MDYSAFSHGQLQSKLWLCEQLEPHVPYYSRVAILGSWYNILGFMLLTRNRRLYNSITGFDIDSNSITIADMICQGFMLGVDTQLRNLNQDINTVDYNGYDVIINCSVEHISSNDWFASLPNNAIICLQTCNVIDENEPWLITNPNSDFDTFLNKYPLNKYLFKGEKTITYDDWGYSRYMIIGTK